MAFYIEDNEISVNAVLKSQITQILQITRIPESWLSTASFQMLNTIRF